MAGEVLVPRFLGVDLATLLVLRFRRLRTRLILPLFRPGLRLIVLGAEPGG
jgi:hypothetical protein